MDHPRLPPWLVKRLGPQEPIRRMKKELRSLSLHTVCEEARCPNIGECWNRRTATIMILGDQCTRHCGFCSVAASRTPPPPDPDEPAHVAEMVRAMGLRHAVITSVARDDLPDGGAGHFAAVIREVREGNPETRIEVLTPDFQGDEASLVTVCGARPDVLNHNLETIERLTPSVRHRATYRRSLEFLKRAKGIDPNLVTKSGIMLGLGETREEVGQAFRDLRQAGCEILTVGQYMRPSTRHLEVVDYVRPEVFEELRQEALAIGFRFVASGPFVRSSYHADKQMGGVGGRAVSPPDFSEGPALPDRANGI